MMTEIHQELGDIKGTVRIIAENVIDIRRVVEKNNDIAISSRENVLSRLSAIDEKMIDYGIHKIEDTGIHKDFDARMQVLENDKSKRAGSAKTSAVYAAACGGILGALVSAATNLLSNWRH